MCAAAVPGSADDRSHDDRSADDRSERHGFGDDGSGSDRSGHDPSVTAGDRPSGDGSHHRDGDRRDGRRPGRRSGRRSSAPEPPRSGAAADDREPDPESVARAIALRLLTGAPRSRAQLAEAMARRDVPDPVAHKVLDRFTEVGLIDDAEYARILVRSRQADRGLARRALGMELRRKGIDDELAAEALSTVDADLEEATARDLVRRRLAATAGLAREVRVRRITAMLGRKGYPGGLAHRVVREALAEEVAGGGRSDGAGPDPAGSDTTWGDVADDVDASGFVDDD